jgi:hypothetical protein
MIPMLIRTATIPIGMLLLIAGPTGARAQSTTSDQLDRPRKVCDVLDDLDKLNGKTISIVGYLEGSTSYGLVLTEDPSMKPCEGGGLRWFRWPGALGISIVPTAPGGLVRLLDKSGRASGERVKVKATVFAKMWRYRFCIGNSCISNGYDGLAGGLKLSEIAATREQ